MNELRFTFDGAPVTARPGQSLAAALTAAGHRCFGESAGCPTRGLFCGMGICQSCLVTVDGTPDLRACMKTAAGGMVVTTRDAASSLEPPSRLPEAPPARIVEPDVLVIGAGAGGLSAAIAARAAGARVTVLDEMPTPGGQYYKQAADGATLDARQAEGAALLAEARSSGAEILAGAEVWGAFEGLLFLAEVGGAPLIARPRTAIVATGVYERPSIVPGWTLPGVMTTGAAQSLWRRYRTLPGRRVAVGGSGPLNLQLALELAAGGAEVALVAEAAKTPFARPFEALRMAAAGPSLTFKGIAMLHALRRRRIPLRRRTVLRRIDAADGGLAAAFRHHSGKEHQVVVDVVCMNAGFEPQNEILRLLGARMRYDPAVGHLRCERGETLETTVPGLFAVGDCAGLGGAPAARTEGRIAGRAAAFAAAGGSDAGVSAPDRRELRRHRRFQGSLWRLHDIAPRPLPLGHDETIVCRCEEVSLARLKRALDENPGHAGDLKRSTRLGMGRCQGRYCGPPAVRLLAGLTGEPLADESHFAPRVPIKPVRIATIVATWEALHGDD